MALRVLRVALILAAFASPAFACQKPGGPDRPIPKSGINQALLSQAILGEVNYQRCRAGRAPLAPAPENLTHVARDHSVWMAGTGRMSHTGGTASGRTLGDRVKRAGLRPKTAAENLAFLPRYRFGGTPFRVANRAACQFLSLDGQRIGQHGYRSLARAVVRMWMESPGHRKNLLSSSQRHMSAAASLSAEGYCGRFYVTQIFTG